MHGSIICPNITRGEWGEIFVLTNFSALEVVYRGRELFLLLGLFLVDKLVF